MPEPRPPGRRRRRLLAVAVPVVVVLLAALGFVIVDGILHGAAVQQAQRAADAQSAALGEHAGARTDLFGLAAEGNALAEAVTDLAEELGDVVDEKSRTRLTAAAEDAATDLQSLTARFPALPVQSWVVDDGAPRAELAGATEDALERTEAARAASTEMAAATAELDERIAAVRTELAKVAGAFPDHAAAAAEANPLASEDSRTALSTAAWLAADAADVAPMRAYLGALRTVRAEHAAALAEQAARESESGGGGDGGEWGGGDYGGGGGGSDGGGPGGGGGGGSDGGGDSGGYPIDYNRYADPRDPNYSPGCTLFYPIRWHDPGPGGTSIIDGIGLPYDYRIEGTWVVVYLCN